MGAIQAGINQSISIAAMLYTQTGHYEQQKIERVNETEIKATKTRIDEINKNYELDAIPDKLEGIERETLIKRQAKGRELIEPLQEELRQRADPKIAEQDYHDYFESAVRKEFEHPIENFETKEETPAAQATKDAEKSLSEERAQKKQKPDKRKIARQIEQENKLKLKTEGGN